MLERFFALVILLILFPLILIFALLVKLSSRGPALFSQKRMGKDFRPFNIYKFRTMLVNAEEIKKKFLKLNEADGPVFKIKNDPRLTTFGKILSRTGLDEIPQLLNVVKGEMSFVGPRPLPISEAKKIPKKYNSRFSVNPGLTSLWIIRGSHSLTFKEWMQSDLEYIRKKNLVSNMYIIAATILLIFRWIIREIKLILSPKSS